MQCVAMASCEDPAASRGDHVASPDGNSVPDRTQCSVCDERYQEQGEGVPKLLACTHTVCLICLRRIEREIERENQVSTDVISCRSKTRVQGSLGIAISLSTSGAPACLCK